MDVDYYKRSLFHETCRNQQGFDNKRKLEQAAKSEKNSSEIKAVVQ